MLLADNQKVLIHFTGHNPKVVLSLIETETGFNVNYTFPHGGGLQESFNNYTQAWTAMNDYIAQAMEEQHTQKESDRHACT